MPSLIKITSALLLLSFNLLSGCAALKDAAHIEKPKASVAGVSVADLSLQAITLLVDVEVANKNAFDLHTSGFDLDLNVAGSKLAKVQQPDTKLKIPAKGSKHVKLPVTLPFKDVYSAVSGAMGKNSVPYGVNGKVTLNVPVLGDISLPLSFEGVLPIPKMPDIKLQGIRLDSAGVSGIKLNMDIEVKNPNMFGLKVNSLGYALKAGSKSLGSGDVKSLTIKKGGTQVVSVPLTLSLSQAGMSLYQALTGKGKVDFSLSGKADITPDLKVWKPGTMKFDTDKAVSF